MKRIFQITCQWLEDRTGLFGFIGKMARHPVPSGARWWYVFGSATLCAFLLQVATGIALALYYIPSADEAYVTLHTITHDTAFGGFIRALHYYGASAMVLMVGAHMAQVFLQGSYKFPREMNWLTGILLLGFTLLMGFTGQILRWDQNAVWTAVVAAKQASRAPL
ncbi:MAG TPA: cytochrome b N-terminal domain-containing protein, partial [bacterium]|nr:cytochrome b N-terminal domain-containing protein [bacterium]